MQRSWKLLASSIHASDHSVLESWKGWIFLISFCSGSHLRISACTAVMQPGIIIIIRAYMATLLHYCQHYASQSPSHLHRSILWCPSCMALLNLASFSCRGRWFWDQIPRIISPAETAPLPLAARNASVAFCSPTSGSSGVVVSLYLSQDKPAALLF
jgi:hypothetical protein